jgi:nicotinamidase-related amidase
VKATLLLIDLQNDYFPGGRMELVGIEEAAANARSLLNHFRRAGLSIVHVQHLARRPDATFFLPGSEGAEIHTAVTPLPGEKVVVKNYPNSFRETGLLEELKTFGSGELVICGAMSHMCIDATTRAAFDLGFSCVLAEDACATRDLVFKGRKVEAAAVHASFMAALAVPYARILGTNEITGD